MEQMQEDSLKSDPVGIRDQRKLFDPHHPIVASHRHRGVIVTPWCKLLYNSLPRGLYDPQIALQPLIHSCLLPISTTCGNTYYDKRIIGCPSVEGDEHDVMWFWLDKVMVQLH